MNIMVEKGNFVLKVSVERTNWRRHKEYLEMPKDFPFNVMAQYDQNTGVTTVDINATDDYAKWAAVRETLAGNGSEYFGECTENNFELSDQPDKRRQSIEYLLVNRVIPKDYQEWYVRQGIEFYELMLNLSLYDEELSPQIVESFRVAKRWLENWLVDNQFKLKSIDDK